MRYICDLMKCSLALVVIVATITIWVPLVIVGAIAVLVEKPYE
jgi:hypothetical protein